MKTPIFLTTFLMLIFLACQNTSATETNDTNEMQIELTAIDDNHPNKEQMEWMLNNYKFDFILRDTLVRSIEDSIIHFEQISFYLTSTDGNLDLFFCDNQSDALILGETFFSSIEGNQKYGVNGAVLFVVSGAESERVNEVLSWFAGEE